VAGRGQRWRHCASGAGDAVMLSVVIPDAQDKRALLQRTLAALDAQELPGYSEWEIVVVNDGSTDDTGAWFSLQLGRTPGSRRCGW
jgi:cellulose synthase/poly-beta-1,6-N-acetylglucosamine synthase-like glycosyltransferase